MTDPRNPSTVAGSDVATLADAPLAPGATSSGFGQPGALTMGMLGREILGQYRVLSKIGRGGMGSVYLAEQPQMRRHVAIKVLHAEVGEHPEAARRFQAEAQAVARLDNPHIVSVYNFGHLESGELYIAMELLEGRTLRQELSAVGRMPVERVVEIVRQIASGLAEAHRNSVIHRDLKPSNVMLLPRANTELVKILDFGIAKVDAGDGTRTRGWVGTPQYMAPEQFTGASVDARTDVYALGLLAYEMLCGRTPFLSENPMSYVHSHVYAAVPTMREYVPQGLSPAIEAVVLSALAKSPEQRPLSAPAFAEQLATAMAAPLQAPAPKSPILPVVLACGLGVVLLGGVASVAAGVWTEEDDDSSTEVAATDDDDDAEAPAPSGDAREDFDPSYVEQLPKEFRGLVELDEDALMKRFEKRLAVLPPSTGEQMRGQYLLQLASMPGEQARRQRKTMLITAIVSMSASSGAFLQDERSTEALVRDYLAAPGPIPVDARKELIEGMRNAIEQESDRDWMVRQWLLQTEKQAKASR
ncbi:MAG: serine/threonine-protein kinase [Myxococcota bacterium]